MQVREGARRPPLFSDPCQCIWQVVGGLLYVCNLQGSGSQRRAQPAPPTPPPFAGK